jgi:hypothetical protein
VAEIASPALNYDIEVGEMPRIAVLAQIKQPWTMPWLLCLAMPKYPRYNF